MCVGRVGGSGAPNRLSQGRSDFQSFGSFGDLANSFQARSPGGCLLTCSGTNLSSLPSAVPTFFIKALAGLGFLLFQYSPQSQIWS